MIPIWVIYARDGLRDLCRKKEKEFRVQFSNAIQAMGAALKAGYSVENAIREAEKDLAPMYEENVRIRKEFRKMVHQIRIFAILPSNIIDMFRLKLRYI